MKASGESNESPRAAASVSTPDRNALPPHPLDIDIPGLLESQIYDDFSPAASSSSSAVLQPKWLNAGKNEELPMCYLGDVDSPVVCRICFGDLLEASPMCAPCDCKGESAWVHRECLQKWIFVSKRNKMFDGTGSDAVCEICGVQWKGEWEMPPPRDESKDWTEEMALALAVAQFRVAHGTDTPIEREIVRVLTPYMPLDAMISATTTAAAAAAASTMAPPPRRASTLMRAAIPNIIRYPRIPQSAARSSNARNRVPRHTSRSCCIS
eukprot:GEMP01016264.1.p1 GENE.GEMP01016264.1~~GEMP01016264.1.p1  ORF type:complete len:267 (+),score=59.32 GEMP01016264.1:272-1072(+)